MKNSMMFGVIEGPTFTTDHEKTIYAKIDHAQKKAMVLRVQVACKGWPRWLSKYLYAKSPSQGDWFIHGTHMILCPDKLEAEWESFWIHLGLE